MIDASARIGVLVGGISGQREISLRSADAVLAALGERGYDARALIVDRDIDILLRQERIGVAFVALQGRYGEDGCVQGLLEVLGIPYTGSGVLASALAMNRAKTKEVLRLHNLPTAPAYVYDAESDAHADAGVLDVHGSFGFPVIVRPVAERSRLATSLVLDESELESAVEAALRFGDQVIVERHVEGRDICVGVLDGEPLGALEVRRGGEADGGWNGNARLACTFPSRLSPERYRSLLRLGAHTFTSLGCEGAGLVALRVSDRGNEVVLDIDTMPVLTPGAIYTRIAEAAGLRLPDVCERLVKGAQLHAHGRRRSRRLLHATFDGPERRAGYAPAAH